MEEEKENRKKLDSIIEDLKSKCESKEQQFNEIMNQKKELNENLMNLEKQVFNFYMNQKNFFT